MLKADRSRSTSTGKASTLEPASPPSQPVIPAALDARLVRLPRPVVVQFARPVDVGAPVVVDGCLIATMHARGTVHHYRVRVGDVLWLVPPVWLTSSSRKAAAKVALPESDQVRKLRLVREFADAIGVTL